ncbi:formate/nitrite transporter family protein [Pararhizobium mangrovi]|uniref:formate/nitrite transporter family protein n=1 Tax=Pararhizobium mangrovi TaxID=2590452 RepID=UPI0015E86B7D|nr:formate/nitrite transporter family protein [Pararhizobium mangrovi]
MLEKDTNRRSQARLSETERKKVESVARFRSPVIYEVIRRQGREELHRPSVSLWVAGVAAGVVMGFSVVAESLLKSHLPDQSWAPLVEHLGYSLGFLIVIMARLQLFTENTITAVLPICAYPTMQNFLAVARLWTYVLLGNLIGTLMLAAFIRYSGALTPQDYTAFAEVSQKVLESSFGHALVGGMISGFLIACLVWLTPTAQAAEFWMVLVITYVIALGGFSHVVVGSAEAWFVVINGDAGFGHVFGGYVLAALIGNVLGGTGLFTLLAYTQVVGELDEESKQQTDEEDDEDEVEPQEDADEESDSESDDNSGSSTSKDKDRRRSREPSAA